MKNIYVVNRIYNMTVNIAAISNYHVIKAPPKICCRKRLIFPCIYDNLPDISDYHKKVRCLSAPRPFTSSIFQ